MAWDSVPRVAASRSRTAVESVSGRPNTFITGLLSDVALMIFFIIA
jgi:hypothetical protein